MKTRLTVTLLAILMVSCGKRDQEEKWQQPESFRKAFRESLEKNRVAGAEYAVFTGDSLLFADHFGLADREQDIPSNRHTLYLTGSVTKVFTAVAIMQLAEQGRLDLDQALGRYLPGFSMQERFPGQPPITLRALLTHHAGIPSDLLAGKFAPRPMDYHEITAYLAQQYPTFPPNTIRAYSNLGYVLLGLVVEAASGENYEDYISKHIFEALGMARSGFYTRQQQSGTLAIPYDRKGKRAEELPLFDVPAGGIYSCLNDMILFGQAFLSPGSRLLRASSLEEMFSLQNGRVLLDLDDRCGLCFTFRNQSPELGRVLEHGGATLYHRAQLYLAPDAGLGAVMLSNSPQGTEEAWRIQEQLMTALAKEHDLLPADPPHPEKTVDFSPIEGKDLAPFAGSYVTPGFHFSLELKKGSLHGDIQGHSFFLLPGDEHAFIPAKKILGITFPSRSRHFLLEEIAGERLFIEAMPWGDLALLGQRADLPLADSLWQSRAGRYEPVKEDPYCLVEDVEIVDEAGTLILTYRYRGDAASQPPPGMVLAPADDRLAFTMGLGRGGGEAVIISGEPGDEILHYAGMRLKKKDR